MRPSSFFYITLAGMALVLPSLPSLAATPFDAVVSSSDTTVDLSGSVANDENLAEDVLSFVVAPLGPAGLPASADLIAYHRDGGEELFTLDTTVELPGGLVVGPTDVVRWDGASYTLELDGAAEGVPPAARIDALSEGPSGDLILSFDLTVDLGGGLVAADEDLVAFGTGGFSSFFDGSGAGVPEALDLDAVHSIASVGNIAVSFDTSGEVGGVVFDDEDVLERSADGSWELVFDASAQHADWSASDLDGLHLMPVPEPGTLLSLAAGLALLASLDRRRRKGLGHAAALLLLVLLTAPGARASNGVIEVNQTRAAAGGITPGDGPGLPITIDTRGSYILTSDLVSTGANETIIEVTSDDVTIDLNGFTVRCSYFINPCAGTGSGDGINAFTVSNTTVRNGTVRDMPADGLQLGAYATVINVRALANGQNGIEVINSGIIRECVAANNLGAGFYIWGGTIVESSSSYSNATGISFRGDGVLVRGNTIGSNTGVAVLGIGGPIYGGYEGNTIVSNNGTTPLADGNQGIALTEIGSNFCGTNTTCP